MTVRKGLLTYHFFIRFLVIGLSLTFTIVSGCTYSNQETSYPKPSQPSIKRNSSATIRKYTSGPQDYNQVAKKLSESILRNKELPLNESKVLALGPVTTDSFYYQLDRRRLQEKLQTILQKSGTMEVSFAVDAMKGSNAAKERYKIMKLQWAKGQLDRQSDSKDLVTWGQLAEVDYLLFGRISSLIQQTANRQEVTYTFNWKLGNCESGLIKWTDEVEYTKSGPIPEVPEWAQKPRGNSTLHFYNIAGGSGKSRGAARADAMKIARDRLTENINSTFHYGQGLGIPVENSDVCPAIHKMQYRSSGNKWYLWALCRIKKDKFRQRRDRIRRANRQWRLAEKKYYAGELEDAEKMYSNISATFQITKNRVIDAEKAILRLAEIAERKNQKDKAIEYYKQIYEVSSADVWKKLARQRYNEIKNEVEQINLFILPRAFSRRSEETYGSWIDKLRRQGFGHALWREMENVLYDFDIVDKIVIPPSYLETQVRQSVKKNRPSQHPVTEIVDHLLTIDTNFFVRKTEQLQGFAVKKTRQFHVTIYLRFYTLKSNLITRPIPASGTAVGKDLLSAQRKAARKAARNLISRIQSERPDST